MADTLTFPHFWCVCGGGGWGIKAPVIKHESAHQTLKVSEYSAAGTYMVSRTAKQEKNRRKKLNVDCANLLFLYGTLIKMLINSIMIII